MHGRYRRLLRDAAVCGVAVRIRLLVRRFRCRNNSCVTVTFVEQVEGLTSAFARFTPPAVAMLVSVGLALAGRAGARLTAGLGAAVGKDTLLRRVRALPDPPAGPVPVLGVDDFAFRRGHRYGTVLVDMQSRRPVDVIDGRDSDGFATWLRAHPGVEVICRDRASGYGEGARQGAPNAVQVADRFHLWRNLGEAVERTLISVRSSLTPPPTAVAEDHAVEPQQVQTLPELKIAARYRVQHADVHRLRATGMTLSAIGRQLGLHQATVRKIANAATVDALLVKTHQRAHVVDEYVAHLHKRWNEGERNATALFREIKQQGYPGGELAVQRHLRRYRHGRSFKPVPGPKQPSVRETTKWIMTHPDRLDPKDASKLREIRDRTPALDRLVGHVRGFARMLTGLQGHHLNEWITAVASDNELPALASFARHMIRDLDAVRNGLTMAYSSGPVEGNVNRIKTLKRQMYGRAKLDLLRKRILLAH
ncbi:ISL3 family transposase [Pilimelia columellifera subsp. columellifera]|uniref:ISL3 family transposase n=1 Tax=Pilimelia columellifera subsp. columellifera TaxID=706583 RepID=A0ABN3NIZ1_9ACTN